MKTIKNILAVITLSSLLFASCSNGWDSHYHPEEEIDSDNLTVVESSAIDYLKSESSFSKIYGLFEETGIIDSMSQKEFFTLLIADNDAVGVIEAMDKKYLAMSHVSDIPFSPANMTDGKRILMWNRKNLGINVSESGIISFNGVKTTKIVKVNDGYIYILESLITSPRSMYEIIENLDDDYSLFREMIMSRNQLTFDEAASIPNGVDETGSTTYDSVFVVTNPYFTAAGFDIMSESVDATMLIPSNSVIESAWEKARADLQSWNLTRADSIIENWVFQSAFFNERYSKQKFLENEDLTSVFDKQWRTTVQEVDLDNPIDMSNGVAYMVNKMKIPTNVLIYRLKDFYHYYQTMTDVDKNKYFKRNNLGLFSIKVEVPAWTPLAGVWPLLENWGTRDTLINSGPWSIDIIPFQFLDHGDGSYTARPYKVPPGEYDLCFGFKEKLGFDVQVYFNDALIGTVTANQTNMHWDRAGQGQPEGYDPSLSTHSAKTRYDKDGGRVGGVTITGDEAIEVKLRFAGNHTKSGNVPDNRYMYYSHWCLKPTKNCY